jgi:hypothetical protein
MLLIMQYENNTENNEDNREQETFIKILNETYQLYIEHGARSNKNVNHFHNFIKNQLLEIFNEPDYKVVLEYNVESINSTYKKKCDIVVLKNNKPYIIFPVKIIKTNYKQNKNNAWENLTGELQQLKWANPDIHIIPINILMNKTPYLKNNKIIDKFETILPQDISIYNYLTEKNITHDMINYIIEVEHQCNVNEEFNKSPIILGVLSETPYRKIINIIRNLL